MGCCCLVHLCSKGSCSLLQAWMAAGGFSNFLVFCFSLQMQVIKKIILFFSVKCQQHVAECLICFHMWWVKHREVLLSTAPSMARDTDELELVVWMRRTRKQLAMCALPCSCGSPILVSAEA